MLDFFSSIVSFFDMIIDLVVNAIQSLLLLFQLVISSTVFNQELMLILPPFLAVSVISFTVISVLKLVIGR